MAWTVPPTAFAGNLWTTSWFNAYVRDNSLALYGEPAWTLMQVFSPYTPGAAGAGMVYPACRRVGARVHCRGDVSVAGPSTPAAGTVVANIPIGYRPPYDGYYYDQESSSTSRQFLLILSASGNIQNGTTALNISLNDISWDMIL